MTIPFVSETCEGELCWCGKPAVRKVGEEFAYDEPNPERHNLTRYICAYHFAELMGPAGARSVGIAPAPEGEVVAWRWQEYDHPEDPWLYSETGPREHEEHANCQPLYASPVVPVGREEIARIIDPVAWEIVDTKGTAAAKFLGLTTGNSLAKADRVLAALRPTDTGRE